jgi:hypothetical protein
MQIAYIVPDLKTAIEQYVGQMKIGPWFVSDHFAGEQKTYRGAPTNVDMTIAMSYSNQMCIELIQQLNDAPSVYTEIRDRLATDSITGAWGRMILSAMPSTIAPAVARLPSTPCCAARRLHISTPPRSSLEWSS